MSKRNLTASGDRYYTASAGKEPKIDPALATRPMQMPAATDGPTLVGEGANHYVFSDSQNKDIVVKRFKPSRPGYLQAEKDLKTLLELRATLPCINSLLPTIVTKYTFGEMTATKCESIAGAECVPNAVNLFLENVEQSSAANVYWSDIKLSNLGMEDGQVKIIDFDIGNGFTFTAIKVADHVVDGKRVPVPKSFKSYGKRAPKAYQQYCALFCALLAMAKWANPSINAEPLLWSFKHRNKKYPRFKHLIGVIQSVLEVNPPVYDVLMKWSAQLCIYRAALNMDNGTDSVLLGAFTDLTVQP